MPINETKEYYSYQGNVTGNISLSSELVKYIIVDENDIATINQLNEDLGKASGNNKYTVSELETIKDLNYNNVDINTLDVGVYKYLTNLTDLTLKNSSMENMIPEILNLKSLENLDLSGNDLKSLPNEFINLEKLEKINVDNNKIADLSLFKDSNIEVTAKNQEINMGDLIQPAFISYFRVNVRKILHDYNDEMPEFKTYDDEVGVDSLAGTTVIKWPKTETKEYIQSIYGKIVYFTFTNNENFTGKVQFTLKDRDEFIYNYYRGEIACNNIDISTKTDIYPSHKEEFYITRASNNTGVNTGKFIEKLVIEDNVNGVSGFSGCGSLKEIQLPEDLCKIGEATFTGCSGLKKITIPKGVTDLGSGQTFASCSNLEEIDMPELITYIGNRLFTGCRNLKGITIPKYVEVIESNAFEVCNSLEYVELPQNLKEINSGAFAECTSLKEITIPEGLITIGYQAFEKCESLEEITIPSSLKQIEGQVFLDSTNLKKATLLIKRSNIEDDEGIGYLDYSVFKGCTNLESINIPLEICEYIDDNGGGFGLFEGCSSINSLTINDSSNKFNDNTDIATLKTEWNKCVDILELSDIVDNITERYFIVNNQIKDLS